MFRMNYVAILALFAGSTVHCADANGQSSYHGPSCLAEFCFDAASIGELKTESDLTRRYGNGYSDRGKFAFYCYAASAQKVFVRFRPYHGEQRQITEVFVTDVPSCPGASPPSVSFGTLATREGLKIGDPLGKVIRLYGKPRTKTKASGIEMIDGSQAQESISTRFGDTVWTYATGCRDDLLHADIYLRNGKVSGILISVSP